jgi:inhibitor of KinA sporulation pathway (predicted exonuclease)
MREIVVLQPPTNLTMMKALRFRLFDTTRNYMHTDLDIVATASLMQQLNQRRNTTGYGYDNIYTVIDGPMQWTAKFDMNNKPIYEGDIVDYREIEANVYHRTIVGFHEALAAYVLRISGTQYHIIGDYEQANYELVGNIIEHKHLLEGHL